MQEGTPTTDAPGSAAELSADEPPTRRSGRRSRPARGPGPRLWIAATALALGGFIGTVIVLNSTLYSSSGFVDRYLGALDRRDLASALDMPGVSVPEGADTGLLIRQATVPVEDAKVVSDVADGSARVVTVAWTDDGAKGDVAFRIEPTAPVFGVFSGWRFAETPLAAVPLTIANAPAVRVNGFELAASPIQGALSGVTAAALAPSRLTLDYESRYLAAVPLTVVAGAGEQPRTVEVSSTPAFVDEVQAELDDYLAACATQRVLQPSGCPFGTFVEDRLVAPPTWSITSNPVVTIVPGFAPDTWLVPATPGSARLSAEVLSLFDGTRAPLSEDVPFTVQYTITVGQDGSLRISAD